MRSVRFRRLLIATTVVAAAAGIAAAGSGPAPTSARAETASSPRPAGGCAWVHSTASPDARAAMVEAKMTVAEKISLVGLQGWIRGYENSTTAIPRLCIPALTMQDGPAGIAGRARGVTQLPAPIALAATWNTGLAAQYGTVIGAEARAKGIDVEQGPNIDIARVPQGGRTWEEFGEDPTLTGTIAAADIRAIQAQGTMATVKHLALNNQETNRHTVNDLIKQRTLREIYLPAFKTVITQAHVASIMCAYNRINGHYACANHELLTSILRDDWKFQGFVRSDRGAEHDIAASIAAGLDQARPAKPTLLAAALRKYPKLHAPLNTAVHRVLREMFAYGLFNRVETGRLTANVTSPAHDQVALKVAESSTVLLKNNGVLPLNSAALKSIAVIGSDAGAWAHSAGIGSGRVHASHLITPVAAIKARAGHGVQVRYTSLHHVRGGTKKALAVAVRAARSAQVAIVFCNDREKEGADRHSLDLPYNQNRLISAVAAANPNTVVVLNTGGAVLMPWLSHVAGVLEAWYPGQQDGQAAAAVLFGDVDPSGKLPLTFPASAKQTPTSSRPRWPGIGLTVRYSEGLYVGYRWYEGSHVRPLFPFGYGLSYTSFGLSDLAVHRATNGAATVELTVANTGRRAGTATPQIYLGYPAAAGEPQRQLRAFTSISLAPGQQRLLRFVLPRSDFTYWNSAKGRWEVASGNYRISAGTSSANVPLHAVIDESGVAGPQ